MKKASKKILTQALEGLVDRLEKTEKFVLDQAPDICKQMVAEYKVDTFMGLAGSVLVTLIGLTLMAIAVHNGISEVRYAGTPDQYVRDTDWMVMYVVGIVVSAVSILPIGINLRNLWFITKCPKLFLLRKFRELV